MPDDRSIARTAASPGLTRDQCGWIVAALVAFVGITYTGPALVRFGQQQRLARQRFAVRAREAEERLRTAGHRARRRMRRLGGGTIWH